MSTTFGMSQYSLEIYLHYAFNVNTPEVYTCVNNLLWLLQPSLENYKEWSAIRTDLSIILAHEANMLRSKNEQKPPIDTAAPQC